MGVGMIGIENLKTLLAEAAEKQMIMKITPDISLDILDMADRLTRYEAALREIADRDGPVILPRLRDHARQALGDTQ